jgi:hypothetical protein
MKETDISEKAANEVVQSRPQEVLGQVGYTEGQKNPNGP